MSDDEKHPPPSPLPTLSNQRTALHLTPRATLLLAFSALGIIYSDIGTSPLYVLSTIWPPTDPVPSPEDVIGGISAIVWAFTLLPFLKYIVFALSFGSTEGEGGPFALYLQMFPRRGLDENGDDDRELTRYSTMDHGDRKSSGSRLMRFRWPLLVWTLFGTSLTIADGILTPAVSITSSVGGLGVVAPVVLDNIVPISVGFILVLFAAQRVGTGRLSFLFAPATLIWLCLLLVSGTINVTSYPGIFRAFDPSRAIMYFVRTGNYDALAGVLLAVTGCEAMFANLGQFNAPSIRLSFILLVYPSLMLAYLGQGAQLIVNGEQVIQNPFYQSIPGGGGGGLWWVTWIAGVFATLIASQAMITATFTLIHQLIGMKCFPSIRVQFTSKIASGQVYIPAINWLLMIGTISVVAGFSNSFALTLAYGFAVATVMFVTTTLLALQIPIIKRIHWVVGVLFFVFFGFLDGLFWGASLRKVPHGAWFPLSLGVVICIFLVFWTSCRELEDTFDKSHKDKLSRVIFRRLKSFSQKRGHFRPLPVLTDDEDIVPLSISDDEDSTGNALKLTREPEAEEEEAALYIKGVREELVKLGRTNTVGIFHKTTEGKGTPHAFGVFVRQVPSLPRVVIFLTVRTIPLPYLPLPSRYLVTKVRSLDGFYGVTMRKGYLDRLLPEMDEIVDRICELETAAGGGARVGEIREAARTRTHIVPSYNIFSRQTTNRLATFLRRIVVEELYGRLRVVFPDESHSPETTEETLKVGVMAVI